MHYIKKTLLLLGITSTALMSCKERVPMDLNNASLIPIPNEINADGFSFQLNKNTQIVVSEPSLKNTAKVLQGILQPATGFDIQIVEGKNAESNQILLSLSNELSKNDSYQLKITEDKIIIQGKDIGGVFYGAQTLRQLLPASIEKKQVQNIDWRVASGTIKDAPRYEYRGAMLDVARHFFSVEEVKQFIDYLAMYKMNYFHIHLTDDQGWRLEIKSWPNLTKIGAETEVGGGEGGFYTQEEYKDIVKYALDRNITVVPEFDMPGHTNAALASYGELNPDNKPKKIYTGTKVGFSTFTVDKDLTYKFIDDVVREMVALTPGEYFHIGGDETHVTGKEDYIKFINRAQKIITSHGKRVVGWADIAEANLEPNTVAQFWKVKTHSAKLALDQKAKLLMSPAAKAYMDIQYDSISPLGLHWAGYTEVDDAYQWDPDTFLPNTSPSDILGIEAPLWSETVKDIKDIQYLTFPRLPGYAEIGWSKKSQQDWNTYKIRLANQKARFEAMGLNYYQSPKVPWNKE
ncbi:beta-N-acetylhexosaminidase [Halosquirtibacter xylanolyticus]|uniref:beta-N-acetylhexosaminidase n=1 Tax=Halosquirtibacter xylanolyticus TaxID=3374599 RepID=UPI0037494B1A|nr:beta-N-acetylhexosaminidase [Prolixibacteraceae bacterium]